MRFVFFGILLLLLSCSTDPEPINYGFDQCRFCEMTIVDKTHAAELVTEKGKSYKFDAIECMVRYMNRQDIQQEYAHILVCNYLEPGRLMPAEEMQFLITDRIPSPMGANLTSMDRPEPAAQMQNDYGGFLLNWDEVKLKFQ